MTLRKLLNIIDADKVSALLAERFYEDDYFPKPKISIKDMQACLKIVISEIKNVQSFNKDSEDELVVMQVWDWSDDDKLRYDAVLKQANDGERYAFELTPWNELIDLKVSDLSIQKYGEDIAAFAIIQEMTFFGYNEKIQAKEIKKAVKSLKNSVKCKKAISAEKVFEDLRKEFGVEEPVETEEEKEKRRQHTEEIVNCNNAVYEEFGFSRIKEE